MNADNGTSKLSWQIAFGGSLLAASAFFGIALAANGETEWLSPLFIGLAVLLPAVWIACAIRFFFTLDANETRVRP